MTYGVVALEIVTLMLNVIYAECRKLAHCAQCRYAECRYAECRDA